MRLQVTVVKCHYEIGKMKVRLKYQRTLLLNGSLHIIAQNNLRRKNKADLKVKSYLNSTIESVCGLKNSCTHNLFSNS